MLDKKFQHSIYVCKVYELSKNTLLRWKDYGNNDYCCKNETMMSKKYTILKNTATEPCEMLNFKKKCYQHYSQSDYFALYEKNKHLI